LYTLPSPFSPLTPSLTWTVVPVILVLAPCQQSDTSFLASEFYFACLALELWSGEWATLFCALLMVLWYHYLCYYLYYFHSLYVLSSVLDLIDLYVTCLVSWRSFIHSFIYSHSIKSLQDWNNQ
jgi:hypothetical protein